ncbi:hypothetical protein [Mucilaginibacter phyllosphaerae]|uniref:Uncharacterized protein n=1 Tax=Mucilaginibacter phyllosphaerae TaxID=1812349 RepID=A0A4Y8A7E9_9SPHI|nr:hypothetical protein [Mucilaginibacter phyllosphaerae]MBB3971008.1 hypothetical protein [Mucilaginibacter phyllosphaerae]TEW63751.1 hypothetical protein E2R65_18450 [Mucilaginibacter phyllosphaerae]GGH21930.1 hypothetical protein GCM10007352_34930 [Mucilaginibacter phyllosphaerae]
MKPLLIFLLFSNLTIKASAQDTVGFKNLSAYVGRKVTVIMPVLNFDIRKEYIYLYMGGWYPNQTFTAIIKRNNGKKRIKLKTDVIIGRVKVSLTGYIAKYDGEPDTTKNYDDVIIKKEFEKPQPMVVVAFNLHGMMSKKYEPRTEPIDLNGKLVMLITDQKQIGNIYELDLPDPNYLPATWPNFSSESVFEQ